MSLTLHVLLLLCFFWKCRIARVKSGASGYGSAANIRGASNASLGWNQSQANMGSEANPEDQIVQYMSAESLVNPDTLSKSTMPR